MMKGRPWVVLAVVLGLASGCRSSSRAASEGALPSPPSTEAPDAYLALDETGMQRVGRSDRPIPPEHLAALEAIDATPWAQRSRGVRVDSFDMARLTDPVVVASPRSRDELVTTLTMAAEAGLPLRMQGHSHSANGSSLAAPYELQISTRQLRQVCRLADDVVRADAGIAIVGLDEWLNERGLRVPVRNDGGSGPSIGGYVSAGGFGVGSQEYGGFWSNVRALEVANVGGEIRRVTPQDEDFAWYFGAQGQLGIIVSAEMDVVPHTPKTPALPFDIGSCEEEPGSSEFSRRAGIGGYYWWSVFVAPQDEAAVARELQEIQAAHPRFNFWEPYRYVIKHRGVWAPLVTSGPGEWVVIGIWGPRSPREDSFDTPEFREARAVEAAFASLVTRRQLRRYLSAEIANGPSAWRAHLGETIYAQYAARKRSVDPTHRLNRGSVFECSDVPCAEAEPSAER